MRRVPCSGLGARQRGVTTDDMRVPARSEVRAGPRRTRQDTDVAEQGSNRVGRRPLGAEASVRASRSWWDAEAGAYAEEHGRFLGDDRAGGALVWGPEGWTEAELGLLGPVVGRRVLEVGAGGAQGARWLAAQGAARRSRSTVSLADARATPRASSPAVPARPGRRRRAAVRRRRRSTWPARRTAPSRSSPTRGPCFAEVARVLRPGGRWVFSVTHPVRWAFPDAPGPAGLVADRPYFDRTPYVELAADGDADLRRAPPHPRRPRARPGRGRPARGRPRRARVAGRATTQTWGGWSPERGRILPGTAIWVCVRD